MESCSHGQPPTGSFQHPRTLGSNLNISASGPWQSSTDGLCQLFSRTQLVIVGLIHNPSVQIRQWDFWPVKKLPVFLIVLCVKDWVPFSAVTCLFRPETQGRFSPEIGLQIRPEVSSLYCGVAQIAGDAIRWFVPTTPFWGGRKGTTPLLSIMWYRSHPWALKHKQFN